MERKDGNMCHHLDTIRPRRRRALTVVHNYFSKRPDGLTPAQHFFGAQHENLFAWLLKRTRLPARPARKRLKPSLLPLLAAARQNDDHGRFIYHQ